MSAPKPRPRHARKEIRAFADWLVSKGWVYETVDSSGHTIWSHPKSPRTYGLPETPRHFDIQRARRDVLRMMGEPIHGKRQKKDRPPPPRTKSAPPRAQTPKPAQRPKPAGTPSDLPEIGYQKSPFTPAQIRAAAESDRRERAIRHLMQPGFRR